MRQITSVEELIPKVYVTDEAVVKQNVIRDGDCVLGYQNETLITKEVFQECYMRWIVGEGFSSPR